MITKVDLIVVSLLAIVVPLIFVAIIIMENNGRGYMAKITKEGWGRILAILRKKIDNSEIEKEKK